MNKKFPKIMPFIITALVSAVVIFAVCMVVELIMMFKCENITTNKELNTSHLVEFATIEQLEKILRREPDNYMAMVKIAEINEELGRYTDANIFYQNAINKSNRSQYIVYRYALFCAKRKFYAVSSVLASEISNKGKKNLKYKAEIYEAIGDTMLEEGQYSAAVSAYQVAYKYAKNVKDDKYYSNIKRKYSFAYIKLADSQIEENKLDEAIASLKNSVKILETPIAFYKLALINIDSDKIKAQKYMERAFEEEPYIVNPYIYNSLLNDLVEHARVTNNNASLNYYSVKYERFKKTVKDIYLYKNDVIVTNSRIEKDKENYYLNFDFENNTKEKIEQLYFVVDIFLNTKWYRVQKKAVYLANTLSPFEKVENFKLVLPSDMEFVDVANNNYIVLKYFAKKSTKAPNTLVKIDAINF